ncbi:Hypothetical protein HEAR3033 [Herminiimonas arsenicoxydans]|uniref:Uncharacterized protein n=1 Tax=Herminiimonas arsenicoxydans TaxID=204773 RepID=A4G9F5_HERAR|nr:Hypothetical protein HEAR3033 [Herminiimonas arsenicoxydans]
MILVSLIGRINEPNHTVYANPKTRYEWPWVRGLQICIYAAKDVKWTDTARSIASERPSYLAIWDADRCEGSDVYFLPHPADVHKPRSEWRWHLDFLPWLPFQNREFACN